MGWVRRHLTAIAVALGVLIVVVNVIAWSWPDGDDHRTPDVTSSSIARYPTRGSLDPDSAAVRAAARAWSAEDDTRHRPGRVIELLWAGDVPRGAAGFGKTVVVLRSAEDVAAVTWTHDSDDAGLSGRPVVTIDADALSAATTIVPPVLDVGHGLLFADPVPATLDGATISASTHERDHTARIDTTDGVWFPSSATPVGMSFRFPSGTTRVDGLSAVVLASQSTVLGVDGPVVLTAETDTATELMRLFSTPVSSEATLEALFQATQSQPLRARIQRDLTVDVVGDAAVLPTTPDRRMVVVSALRYATYQPVQSVGAALYSSSGGTVQNAFVMAELAPTTSEAGDPVAAGSWLTVDRRQVLAYATSRGVTSLQLYVGRRPAVELQPGVGVLDDPGLFTDPQQSLPPVALLGATSDGTVVPGSPVIER